MGEECCSTSGVHGRSGCLIRNSCKYNFLIFERGWSKDLLERAIA
jgi:hypothetical protein